MARLEDYELQRGDWVKFYYNGWCEFQGRAHELYCFYDKNYDASGGAEVEAVLRPSFVMRDQLDEIFIDCKYRNYNGLTQKDGECHSFEIIQPKEEKKSLSEDIYTGTDRHNSFNPDQAKVISRLAAEIDKLKERIK